MKQKVLRAFLGMLLLTAALMLAFVIPATLSSTVQGKPAFMDRYNRDPYAKLQWKDKCTLCHIGKGGEQRNDFGDAFEDAGHRITPKLRTKFPKLFEDPKTERTQTELDELLQCEIDRRALPC